MHFCRKKIIYIPYSEYVSAALYIQHAERIRRIVVSSVAYPAVPHFATSSHKRYYFTEKGF